MAPQLQCSYLENPRDGGAWWAAVYGVAQSWTRLKRLSSSTKGSHTATAKSPLVLAASAPEGEKREGLHERVLAPSLPGCVANGRSQPAPPAGSIL